MKKLIPLPKSYRKSAQTVCLCGMLGLAGQSYGTSVIDAVTYDASYDLTSVTIEGTTYTELTGSTASITTSSFSTWTAFWIGGTTPITNDEEDLNAASSGLNVRDAATNLSSGSTFQFGQTITDTDTIFIIDYGNGDPVTFGLINSDGETVGDYSLTIVASDFGNDIVTFATEKTEGLSTDDSITTDIDVRADQGVSFTLSDFTGTYGDLSTATGIVILSTTTLDPAVVGLASIPEPNTFALLAGLSAFAAIAVRRRRS
jgi:hypothetical protein